MAWFTAVVLSLTLSAAPSAQAPTIGVMALRADVPNGEKAVNSLTDLVVQRVREERCFSRVVGFQEIQDLVSAEQQRQVLACDEGGCLAEIAGALGVDLLLSGSVGQIGTINTISLRVLDARTAMTAASVTDTVEGGIEQIVRRLPQTVHRLMVQGKYVALSSSAPVASTDVSERPRWPGRVALGAGAGALLPLVASVAMGAASLVVLVLPTWVALPWPGSMESKKAALLSGSGGAGVLAVVLAAVSLGMLAVAAAGLGVGAAP